MVVRLDLVIMLFRQNKENKENKFLKYYKERVLINR